MLICLWTFCAFVFELLPFASPRSIVPQEEIVHDLRMLSADLDKSLLTEEPYVQFTKSPIGKSVHAGEDLELNCEAVGVPPPVISWTLNGKPYISHYDDNVLEKLRNVGLKTVQSGITASKVFVRCASRRHAGEFKCIASNAHRMVEVAANVTVEGHGRSPCDAVPELSPPVITMWSDGRFERSGASAQLFCRATNGGYAQTSWYDEERNLLNRDANFQVLFNGDLLIRKAKWANLGMYTCVVSNEFGEDRASTFFYPTEPDMKR